MIAFDSSHYDGGGGSDFSFTNTAGNFVVIALIGQLATDNISGVTYGGQTMTLAQKVIDAVDRSIYIFILHNAPTGSNTVSTSFSSSSDFGVFCASYSGVKTSGQPEANATKDETTVSSQTTSVTTVADNAWTVGFFHTNSGKTYTYNSGTTKRLDDTNVTGALVDSNGVITPPGSTSLGVSFNTAASFAESIVISIAPSTATAVQGIIII